MKRLIAAVAGAWCLVTLAGRASAETVDAKAFRCKELADREDPGASVT